MGDNGKFTAEPKRPEEGQDIVLTIIITPEGKVNVNGPITNEPLSFWLLDKAKDIIKAYNIQQMMINRPIVQPKGGIMNFIRGRG